MSRTADADGAVATFADLLRSGAWALGFFVLTIALRIPFVRLPFGQQDESYYAVVARATAAGRRLYADIGYVRPPGLNAVYVSAWRVSDGIGLPYDVTVRVFAALFAAGTVAVASYWLFRRLDPVAAFAGSALFAVFSASFALQSEANSETWMMLPYAASALMLLHALDERVDGQARLRLVFCAGALTGAAALFKEVALVNLALPVLAALALGMRAGRKGWWLRVTATFAAGALATGITAVLVLAASGQARDFVYHTWVSRFLYVSDTHAVADVFSVLGRQLEFLRTALVSPLLLGLLAYAAACLVPFTRAGGASASACDRRYAHVAFGWLVLSLIGVALSGRFYQHYFIQATAATALLLAASLSALRRGASPRRGWIAAAAAALGLAAVGFAAASWVDDTRMVDHFRETRGEWIEVARIADENTPSGGTLLVWGTRVSAMAYAQTPSATDVAWVHYGFGEPGGHEFLGKSFPSAGDRVLRDLAQPPDTIVLTARLGVFLPNVPDPPFDQPDDLRVHDAIVEMIESGFRVIERSDTFVVLGRVR